MARDDKLAEAYAVKNFNTLLGTLEDGQLNSDLSDDLEDCVRDLQEAIDRGVKRKITVNVTVELTADRGVIEVSGGYKIKKPAKSRRRTLMFVHAGCYLSSQDERQGNLELRAVSDNSQPMRTVEA
jgi:hypothetical protein